MCGGKNLCQCRRGGRDAGKNLLIDREQVQVFGLKRFNESWHGICAETDQILCNTITFGRIRKLGDETFCFALFSTSEPVDLFILL